MLRWPIALLACALAAVTIVNVPSAPPAGADDCAAPTGQAGCWVLDFEDQFSGADLDLSAWERGWFVDEGYSRSVNQWENACYDTDNVSVAGGMLWLRLDASTDPACQQKNGAIAPYAGGLISSRDAITDASHPVRLDGEFHVEARIWLPTENGRIMNWPTFWSTGFGPWPVTGEIDMLEGLGGTANFNYHYTCPGGGHCQVGKTGHPEASLDGNWHVYGASRRLVSLDEPATVTFWFDGQAVGTITEDVVTSPHYLILSHTSHQFENPIAPGRSMLVDWVRSWIPTEAGRGDATCTDGASIVDALAIAQYTTGTRTGVTTCPLADPADMVNIVAGDVDGNGTTNIVDALALAQCTVGLDNRWC